MYYDVIHFPIKEIKNQIKYYLFSEVKNKIIIGEPEKIIKNIRKANILYCPKYEISLEMFAKAQSLNKPFLISISDLLNEDPHIAIYRISNFIRVGRHYDIKFVLVTLAKDKYSLRDIEEATSILRLCGMSKNQVRFSFSILERYL